MRKHFIFGIAAMGLVAFGCSSTLSVPEDDNGVAKSMSTAPTSDEVCAKLTTKSTSCAWSQSATVGCSAALRNASTTLTTALETCLGIASCDDARTCVDGALVGASTPAPITNEAGADAGPDDDATSPTDGATLPSTDAAPTPTNISCTHAVDFADPTCKTCMDTSCCGESAICGKSPACVDLLTCVADCSPGDTACVASCKSIRASTTISAFDDLETCRAASCNAACPTF